MLVFEIAPEDINALQHNILYNVCIDPHMEVLL